MSIKRENLSPLLRFVWYHLPPFLVAASILFLSSIPYLHGPQIETIGVDKIAHLTEYGVFAWFLARSLLRITSRARQKLTLLLTWAFLVLFASGDELLQSFVPGRDSSGFDVLADSCGAALALFLAYRKVERNQT